MTTQDITRHLLQLGKHYSGARMQQGRTVLDSDWNEDAMLEAEDLRDFAREDDEAIKALEELEKRIKRQAPG